jgi:hypothetical protein
MTFAGRDLSATHLKEMVPSHVAFYAIFIPIFQNDSTAIMRARLDNSLL